VPLFYLGKYAVTIEQWAAVTGALPDGMKIVDETFTASRRQPVVRVSYDEAEAFCTRLSQTAGRAYRLPTEAEWEYACRGGTAAPFAFGETVTPQVANCAGAPPGAQPPEAKTYATTMPVGSLGAANGFGLFDMHGNVWEWCQDLWHSDYAGAPVDGSAWRSGADRRTRVLRGGSWSSAAGFCRAAARSFSGDPALRSRQIGFRLAMTAGAP
jgi:formylglycine-generating enzyme required for sulfatase activity